MSKSSIFFAVAVLAAAVAAPASAQGKVDRQGLYVDVGVNYTLGVSGAELTGSSGEIIGQTTNVAGFTGAVGLGLKSNMFRLGFQYDMYSVNDVFATSGLKDATSYYTLAGTFYPSATDGFWGRLNLGYGSSKVSGASTASGTSSGFAAGFAVGYDILMSGDKFAISPYLSYLGLLSGGDFGGDFSGAKAKNSVMQIGFTLGYKH